METVYVLVQKLVGFPDDVVVGVFKSEQAALSYSDTIISKLEEDQAAMITHTVVRTTLH